MGRDIHVRIVIFKYDTNQYEEVMFYRKNKDKFEAVDFYPYRNYELFNLLTNEDNFPMKPLYKTNLPENLCQEIESYEEEFGYFNFEEVNLADLKYYFSQKKNYEDEDEKKALREFIEIIENALNFYDSYWLFTNNNSDVRILYWFDN